jgi:hypothetical protein
MCYSKDMSAIKKGKIAKLTAGEHSWPCHLAISLLALYIWSWHGHRQKLSIAERKIGVNGFNIRANIKGDCDSTLSPLPGVHATSAHYIVFFLFLWICKYSHLIISCSTFSGSGKVVLWKYCIAKILSKRKVVAWLLVGVIFV